VLALSGIVLGASDIDEAPLALGRFDLWPALLRGERELGRVAVAAAIPLLLAGAVVLWFGDEFGAAISYHTGRALQVESVGASILEIGAINDAGSGAEYGSGSFNYVAGGAEGVRAVSIGLLVTLYALVLWAGWRSRVSHLKLATALLAVLVVLSPVLSPQFLFWLLPLSAAAYGLSLANGVLLVAFVMTQLMLQFYARVVVDFDPEFVWRLVGRNAALLIYLALVCVPIVRAALRDPEPQPT
jgi:hypothetical protein